MQASRKKHRKPTRARPVLRKRPAVAPPHDAAGNRRLVPRHLPIIGIGASAGGLEAFKKFFAAVPPDSGMAFVLIQHLDPTRDSLTAELLGSQTPLRVVQVEDRMRVAANRVYVIPPNKYLSVRANNLRLSEPTATRSLRMAIDFFLRSLAQEKQEQAIGIVLSGTGTDGTLGLKEIKAAGGITMVQDPYTAQYDGMPRSAIASGCADYVLPPEDMPEALRAYVGRATVFQQRAKAPSDTPADPVLRAVTLLHARLKFDFSGYKTGTLRRRMQRRMNLKHVDTLSAYLKILERDEVELNALFKDLLINVTSFFREPAAWQALQEQVIRPLVAEKEATATLRAWVPACATGEEAYSLAMLFLEELEAAGKSCGVQVFASDVDADALDTVRLGVYPEGIAANVSPERLRRFFIKDEHSYRVNQRLRDSVVVAQQSLISDPPFSKLDLISCRNLFIYLEPPVQARLIALLHFALVDGGYLFLGSAEGIGSQEDLFEAVSKKARIYRRIGPTRHEKVQFPTSAARQHAMRAPSPGRLVPLAQQLLLQRFAPACVIINRTGEILYYQGRTDDYLLRPTGIPTQDLMGQVRPALASKLRGAVRESIRTQQRVVVSASAPSHSTSARVCMTVESLNESKETRGLWLVSFKNEGKSRSSAPIAASADEPDGSDVAFKDLESELKSTSEDLQNTIEDLRAANEELMSVNEELQSTNEELETSQEELQALNEELSTANLQLEGKIGELEASNNDLDNLLASTNVATVFLDTQLCIRRFTPAATRLFSLIPSDIGRPISDIAQKFADPSLLAEAAAVLQEAVVPHKEVQGNDGRWYVRQVLPYRTREHRTEGVVITLSDVAAEALEEARHYAESIVDTVREPLVVLDADLRVRSANRSFYTTFDVTPDETAGQSFFALGDHQWDIPQLRTLLNEILPRRRVLNDFEVEHDFESIGRHTMLLNARALWRGGDRPDLILLAIEDVTERKQAQAALRESDASKRVEDQVRQRQAELAHALRIITIGELASGLAHELNQPLSAIANGVEACARYVRSGTAEPAKLLALLDDASAEALRAGDIVEHLRGFIQKGTPQCAPTDLGEIARSVARMLGRELAQEQITLRLELGTLPLPLYADRIQIEQVIVNLIQNAIDAIREAGNGRKEVDLEARIVKGVAEVAVRDRGAGVSAAAAERLFEAFFTTKAQGLGMGLAISRSIVEAHQGRIWVERPADGGPGTTVRFTLSLQQPKEKRKSRS